MRKKVKIPTGIEQLKLPISKDDEKWKLSILTSPKSLRSISIYLGKYKWQGDRLYVLTMQVLSME